MTTSVSGRIVYITGGASGLGEAMARRFAANGDTVAIADIQDEPAAELARQLPGSFGIHVDTADSTSIQRSIAQVEERCGRIDVVINNAGIVGEQVPIDQMEDDRWFKVTRINGDGAFFVLREGIAALLRGGGGDILNTGSTAGLVGMVNLAPYSYAKAGLIQLTRAAAIEYANHKIRVNAIAPTMVMTPLVEHFLNTAPDRDEAWRSAKQFNPMPGMPTPADIAGIAFFLCSPDAHWITGHTVPIDGGYVAQ